MRPLALSLALLALASATALAQSPDEITYTEADATTLSQCLETVQQVNSDIEAGAGAYPEGCIGTATDLCQSEPDGSTTIGIAECNLRETAWWDEMLNTNYAELQDVLEPAVFDSLKTAQRAWIAFRDAECSFQYDLWGDGTMRTIAHTTCLLQQTGQRALALAAALDLGP